MTFRMVIRAGFVAALAMALLQSCSGWTCTDCTIPAECVGSCPPNQQFDGCVCIGGDDADAAADARADVYLDADSAEAE
jgi:hypothetical protein